MKLVFEVQDGNDMEYLKKKVFLWSGKEDQCSITKAKVAWCWDVEVSVGPRDNILSLLDVLKDYTKSVRIR